MNNALIFGAPQPRYGAQLLADSDAPTYCIVDRVYDSQDRLEAIVCCCGPDRVDLVVAALNALDDARRRERTPYPASLVVARALEQSTRLG